MKVGRFWTFLILVLSLLLAGCFQNLASDAQNPKITKEELKSMLGNTDVIIVDVRLSNDWEQSKSKILGAIREDPEGDVKTWADQYSKEKTLVFYCA